MSKLSLEKEYCPPVHIRWAIRPDPDSASLKWSQASQAMHNHDPPLPQRLQPSNLHRYRIQPLRWRAVPTTQPQQTPGPVPKPSQAVPTVAANLQRARQSVLHAEQRSNNTARLRPTRFNTVSARFPCGSCSFPATSNRPFRVQNKPGTEKHPGNRTIPHPTPLPPGGHAKRDRQYANLFEKALLCQPER